MKSPHSVFRNGRFFIENVSVENLARRVGTPFYAYSRATIADAFQSYARAFGQVPHLVCYSLKANSNLAIARTIASLGGGADIVSGGELRRALTAGFDPKHIIFSGVGKTKDELALAIKKNIRLINVESE